MYAFGKPIIMKKLLIAAMAVIGFCACSNNEGEGGTMNDGLQKIDSNGAAADTAYKGDQSKTDTAKGEHRTDRSMRDTLSPQ